MHESKFTGGFWGYWGMTLLAGLISTVTLGIGLPWAVCMLQKWKAKHTYIDGMQLRFDGTGMQLLGNWILWYLLTVFTFGIYGVWATVNLKKWVVKHTHVVGYDGMSHSVFEASALEYLGMNLAQNAFIRLTCYFAAPWAEAMYEKWYTKNVYIDGHRLRFDGNGFQLLGKYIIWWLLSWITCGIYAPFMFLSMERWLAKHTHFSVR